VATGRPLLLRLATPRRQRAATPLPLTTVRGRTQQDVRSGASVRTARSRDRFNCHQQHASITSRPRYVFAWENHDPHPTPTHTPPPSRRHLNASNNHTLHSYITPHPYQRFLHSYPYLYITPHRPLLPSYSRHYHWTNHTVSLKAHDDVVLTPTHNTQTLSRTYTLTHHHTHNIVSLKAHDGVLTPAHNAQTPSRTCALTHHHTHNTDSLQAGS
jgi:hypothetical protein